MNRRYLEKQRYRIRVEYDCVLQLLVASTTRRFDECLELVEWNMVCVGHFEFIKIDKSGNALLPSNVLKVAAFMKSHCRYPLESFYGDQLAFRALANDSRGDKAIERIYHNRL